MAIHLSPPQASAQEAHHGSTLLDRVGNTPLLRLSRVTRDLAPAVELYAKAEWFNPSGSVKDRPAAAILRQGRETGALSPEKALLDSTSGNMEIAYATLGAALALRVCLMVPANVTPERLAILRALNAEITLTDPLEGTEGARKSAVEVAAKDPDRYYFADQFGNSANWQAHYHTTGPELAEQTNGRLTHFVAGLGTSGTLMGAGRYLRETIPQARLIAVQPDQPMHGLEGLKHFASSTVPPIFDPSLPDETLGVRTEEAHAMARRLAREEGLLVGVSAGAAVVAALRVARELEEGVVVTVLADPGHKYLSRPFWSEG
ncbi:MAG: PLP-dependent cysteine synthase family protein [Anaerolineales bacterium]|nr:PLP-dependent cysteine synthase family protein [Anaerolineales bacterium]